MISDKVKFLLGLQIKKISIFRGKRIRVSHDLSTSNLFLFFKKMFFSSTFRLYFLYFSHFPSTDELPNIHQMYLIPDFIIITGTLK